MKKLFFLLPVLLLADVDPFKAGNLNSPNPYGLTPQEKAILQNKKNIQKNSEAIKEVKSQLNKLKSNLTQKFIEYDQSISDLQNKMSSFNTLLSEVDAAKQSVDQIKKDMNGTKIKDLEERITALEEQNRAIKKTIEEITQIQNENFQNLSNSIQIIINQLKKMNGSGSLDPKVAFDKAKKLYFSGKLSKAKELFLYSLSNKHLPATSAYYLGEISYKQKKYKEALGYYKKSIEFYPKKTSFTERLLYHTGMSFLNLNQKTNAKLTFQKLIHDYPNSKYATLAKKELEKL